MYCWGPWDFERFSHFMQQPQSILWHLQFLSGTFGLCQHGANSHFFRFFSTFGLMHQNVDILWSWSKVK